MQAKQQTKLRTKRIAAVTAALFAQRTAFKAQRYSVAVTAAQQAAAQAAAVQQAQALQAQAAALLAQHGIQVGTAARANSATSNPSAALVSVAGQQLTPCKAAQAIAAQHYPNRKAAMQAAQSAGINPATASTQYGIYAKQQKALVAA